jgi:hypothetical protein
MKSTVLRLIGILCLVAAVAAAVLSLKRVADLGMPWLAPLFIIVGAAFVIFAKRARN